MSLPRISLAIKRLIYYIDWILQAPFTTSLGKRVFYYDSAQRARCQAADAPAEAPGAFSRGRRLAGAPPALRLLKTRPAPGSGSRTADEPAPAPLRLARLQRSPTPASVPGRRLASRTRADGRSGGGDGSDPEGRRAGHLARAARPHPLVQSPLCAGRPLPASEADCLKSVAQRSDTFTHARPPVRLPTGHPPVRRAGQN
ncbi:Metabotropic Glutamate Receptor 5 [Manis pentadactyla]|nr:Metabotropic Glutamate Receptor 5 [Manis pentadactyla]